jgi:hypothetical protein
LEEAAKLEEKKDSMLEMFLSLYNTERRIIQLMAETYKHVKKSF